MTNYNDLAPASKVWIYTSEREFTNKDLAAINAKATSFITEWESHGKSVKGLIEIRNNRFIFIYADDEGDAMCGRAMDSSIQLIKELEQDLGITLMDRMLLAYKDAETISTTSLPDFEHMIKQGKVTEDTTVFNCILTQKSDLNNWEVAAKDSWHKQLFY
jgi:hypothetical protein